MSLVKWQILIPTIGHRHAKLMHLLAVLGVQMLPGAAVIAWRDNLEHSYAEKLQGLMDAATAEYVSTLADDDSVAHNFVPRVLTALATGPDYVGFRVRYTENGAEQSPVTHSLACGGWTEQGGQYLRDLTYYNPIKRELAQQVRFRGAYCDTEWAADLRALGCVKSEVFIDAEMLYYQRVSGDNFHTPRAPLPPEDLPPLPSYPWLSWL